MLSHSEELSERLWYRHRLPGPVEFASNGPIASPTIPGWDGHPVRELFGERYSLRDRVNKGANVMALDRVRAAPGGYGL